MALNLDPITGLPSDYLAPDSYQIPLNSRPQLAPEWSPDHLPPNALHPDNMPSMFATVQAQNSLNPELPQALTTDGKGNLNVNAIGGGGGGGGGSVYGATNGDADWATATSHASVMHVDLMERPTTLWRVQATAALSEAAAGDGVPDFVRVSLLGLPNGSQYDIGMLPFIQRTGIGAAGVCDVQTIDIIYPGGWTNLPFYDVTSTFTRVVFECLSGFVSFVGAAIEWS